MRRCAFTLAKLGDTDYTWHTVKMEDAFSGSAGMPASIFDLGIGPIINASWVLSGLMLFKALGLATQIKELQRNGREVRSKPQHICGGRGANV